MESITFTPDQLHTIKLLVRIERQRIQEQSPHAITDPYPGSWVEALQQIGLKLDCFPYGPGF